jgi:3-oxoacyl-[acyl-carrier protein] reductase
MINLSGRVAIVTGASRGIGRSIARTLGTQGAVVIAAARGDNARAVAEEIVAAGGEARAASVDVTDRASVDRVVAEALERHGRIDVLVNNAGIARDQLLLRMKQEDWDAVLATNLTGAFHTVQAALKPMIKQRSGRIVNITSVVGLAGNAGQANYAASKAGLVGFTKSVAREVASRAITVNAVAPGFIDTDMTTTISAEMKEGMTKMVPLGRTGRPEEVAAAIAFLCSDEASYVTGETLRVNGGMYV